jgi:NitT/TauT family transport system substrate-binding protein
MPARWRPWGLLVACVVSTAGLVLAACGGQVDPAALEVPVAPWVGYAYLPLAQKLGLAQAAGAQLRFVPYDDHQDIVQAWLAGRLSLAPLTSVEVVDICARRRDRCPVIVLVLDESQGADTLILHRSIQDLRNLRGRRVGVAASSLGPYLVSQALASVGLDIADVRLVPMKPGAMASALHNGRIEAAASYPPFSDLVLRLGIGRVAFDSRALPGQIRDLLVVDPQLLASQPEALARLLLAWHWAHRWAQRHPEPATAALASLQKVSASAVRRAQELTHYTPLEQQQVLLAPGGSVEASLQTVQQVEQGLGIVPADAPLPEVSNALVERALQLAASTSAPK